MKKNKNIPKTEPNLNLNNDIIKDIQENNSPNFIAKSSNEKNENFLSTNNNNSINNENEESEGDELNKIVPGSVGNRIKHFEVIQEEKTKEKQVPQKLNRRAFRNRVDSMISYKRESLALLALNPENKLIIQTMINQLDNNQNTKKSDQSNSNPSTPLSASSNYQYSHLRNEISDNSTEDAENNIDNSNKLEQNNNEDEHVNIIDSENENHNSYSILKKNSSSPFKPNNLTIDSLILRNKRAKSQDSPLRISSCINEKSDSSLEEQKKLLSEESLPDKPSFDNDNLQQNTEPKIIHHGLSSSNDDIISETEDSLDELISIEPVLRKSNASSDTQINKIGISNMKMVKKQFVPVPSKKNSRANVNIKSIHIKGNGEHLNNNPQENSSKTSNDILLHQRSASDSITPQSNGDISNNQTVKVVEVKPLMINTKTTSDSSLYKNKNNDITLNSKSAKSFVAIPSTAIKKQVIRKNSKPAELRHIKKKSSISTIGSQSDDSVCSSHSASSEKSLSLIKERRSIKVNGYDADILYEYFDEDSENENYQINTESTSVQDIDNLDKKDTPNSKFGNLSIKTDLPHNFPGVMSSEIMTSTITPLDQVYNSISQELEERLCKTVRRSILQRVDSKNYMIPINILYEKHYKNQVIYVERKTTVEEVLCQALNSINIYEDYGNYELLQIFGFEDVINEDEQEDENRCNNDNNDINSPNTESSTKYQNVLDLDENIQSILDKTIFNSKRKSNNILTFRIRKKSSTMKLYIYFEEEKRNYNIMVTKTTTCEDVIEALLFLRNEPYDENVWYIQKKNLEMDEEDEKEILEPFDILYNKDENIRYILRKKKSKQISKLVNILGVTDETDLHDIVDKDKKKKDKDKNKVNCEMTNEVPNDNYYNYNDEKEEKFSRILGLSKEELNNIYTRNKKINELKKMDGKKKNGSYDQLNLNTNSKDVERFPSQVLNIFKSKKEKQLTKLQNTFTGSMPQISMSKNESSKELDNIPKISRSADSIGSDGDFLNSGKRAKKLGNFFGITSSQRENTELNNIIRKNYNSKKTLDSSEQYIVIRVYFANLTYTTINMSINDTCKTAKKILCERLGIKEADEELYQIYEFTQKNGYEREVHNSERPFDTMRGWQKDEIFLFKLKNNTKGKAMSRGNIYDKIKNKYSKNTSVKSPLSSSEDNLSKSPSNEQPVKRMAKLAGFFGVVNSKQEEKNNTEKEEEVKGLFNMLHVMSNSKEEATNQIIKFIHSKDIIEDNAVKEGWLYMQVGKSLINSWCYKDNNENFNIRNWKSGDITRIAIKDIVSVELSNGKGTNSGDNIFSIVVKKDGSGPATQYLFKAKFVIDAIEWVTSLKPNPNKSNKIKKTVIEDDSNFKDNYDALNVIGKGKYSVVFLCKEMTTSEPFAVKILNKQYKDMWEIEKEVLKSISHPFIVDLFQAFEYEDHNYLVMEFINGGDLYFHLSQYGRFSEIRVRFYAAELLLALESLHGHNIIYRDLKLENIMITKEGHIKLVDFGQSIPKFIINIDEVSDMSNIEYIAPEILCGKNYSFASDWWAYGVIIYEMLCEKHPFYSNEKEEIVQRILQSPIEFPPFPSRFIKDLILKLLNRDSEKRLGSSSEGGKEIQNHPFFEKIDFTKLYHLEIKPPFKPNVEDAFDIQYFDTQFTDEPIVNISDNNIYEQEIYENNNENESDGNISYTYSYQGDDKSPKGLITNDSYDNSSQEYVHKYSSSNDNKIYNEQSETKYSYINSEDEESHNDNSLSIQQQRLNNGWGSNDDDIIEENNNHDLRYSEETNYTQSYIEKQEQRIKNGW
jgi:serine/threonine protein kinase